MIHEHLQLLSDPTRVRMLRVLALQELGVGELAEVLQAGQSSVSRHLKALHTAGWVLRRSAGTSTLVQMTSPENLPPSGAELWAVIAAAAEHDATASQDAQRLAGVLARRRVDSSSFFGRVAASWSDVREELFGGNFTLPTLLAVLAGDLVIGDLGCGNGETAAAIAPHVSRVIAVDNEPAMLEAAARRLESFDNVELRPGELAALPIDDEQLDAAVAMLVLHHVADIAAALAEIRRALRPGGRLVVLDMTAHDRQSYRHTMGHQHLGFTTETLQDAAIGAGLVPCGFRLLPPDPTAQGPGLFVATFRRD